MTLVQAIAQQIQHLTMGLNQVGQTVMKSQQTLAGVVQEQQKGQQFMTELNQKVQQTQYRNKVLGAKIGAAEAEAALLSPLTKAQRAAATSAQKKKGAIVPPGDVMINSPDDDGTGTVYGDPNNTTSPLTEEGINHVGGGVGDGW